MSESLTQAKYAKHFDYYLNYVKVKAINRKRHRSSHSNDLSVINQYLFLEAPVKALIAIAFVVRLVVVRKVLPKLQLF